MLIQTFSMIKKRVILKDKLISNLYLIINMKIKKTEIKCMNIMNNQISKVILMETLLLEYINKILKSNKIKKILNKSQKSKILKV